MKVADNVQIARLRALQGFQREFQRDPKGVAIAPGRVNLIGEHTDYNEGFVFPVAVDRVIAVAVDAADNESVLISESQNLSARFIASDVQPGEVSGWGAYGAGMAWVLADQTKKELPNMNAYVASNLPMGSGVSSSAALEVAFGVGWNALATLELSNRDLAFLAQRCEREYVGVNCGIMDMMASAMGQLGHALLLDTRSFEISAAPIPADIAIVLCDTCTPRTLAGSAYNQRRAECEEAAKLIGVASLRDAQLDDLNRLSGDLLKRARHVVTENQRCLDFAQALSEGDHRVLGLLMAQSHASLRDDYQVSSAALDKMEECARNATGCIGVRMTGAGFGGACVALVNRESVFTFIRDVGQSYEQCHFSTPEFSSLNAVDGAAWADVFLH